MISICAMVCIVAAYGIYMLTSPDGTDGVLFGTVMLLLGALGGVKAKEILDGRTNRLR